MIELTEYYKDRGYDIQLSGVHSKPWKLTHKGHPVAIGDDEQIEEALRIYQSGYFFGLVDGHSSCTEIWKNTLKEARGHV